MESRESGENFEGELSSAELIELHCETLYRFDEAGDTVSTNDPHEPAACGRLHLGWNDKAVTYRFRHDVAAGIRDRFRSWLSSNSPIGGDKPSGLKALGEIFGVDLECKAGGPAYYAATALPPEEAVVAIDATNEHLLRADYLEEGEIEFVQPCRAVIVNARAVSVCLTVRRAKHGVEAGVNTEPEYRGRGLAGRVTAAWISAVHAEGLIPFYSTWAENIASQRVADRLGLSKIGWELFIE